jgi:hypothetical protein
MNTALRPPRHFPRSGNGDATGPSEFIVILACQGPPWCDLADENVEASEGCPWCTRVTISPDGTQHISYPATA